MSIWDEIKKIKLVEIINQFKLGSFTINLGGVKHYHFNIPPQTEVKKLEGVRVTQAWEKEYAERLEQDIRNKEPRFTSLSEAYSADAQQHPQIPIVDQPFTDVRNGGAGFFS